MPMPPLCPVGMAAVMQPCCKASVLAALVSLRSERTKRPLEQLVVCTGERGRLGVGYGMLQAALETVFLSTVKNLNRNYEPFKLRILDA